MKNSIHMLVRFGLTAIVFVVFSGVAISQTYTVEVDQVLNGSKDTLFVGVSVAQVNAPSSGFGVLVSGTIDLQYDPSVWVYGYSATASAIPYYNTFPRLPGTVPLFVPTFGLSVDCPSPDVCGSSGASTLSVVPSRGPSPANGNEADICDPPTGTCAAPVVRLTMTDQNLTNAVIVPDAGASVLIATHAFTLPAPVSAKRSEDETQDVLSKLAAVSGTAILVDSSSLVVCFADDLAIGSTSCCDGRGGGAGFCTIDNPQPNLPVELSSFEATSGTDAVVLSWETSSEDNNAGFSIEHARGDDTEFSELAFVEGHGTTVKAQSYVFRVTGLNIGRHRFRLRQIDFDGAFEYSAEVEAVIELAGTHRLGAAYPNPFNPSTTFELIVGREQQVQIDIINALGQRVQRLYDGPLEANEPRNFVFEARMLPTGLYFYRVAGETFTQTRQMLLVK